LGWAFLFRTQ